MSKTEIITKIIESKDNKLNIKIKLCNSEEEPINSNKTEETLFKSESVDLNKINKIQEINNNNKDLNNKKEKEKKVKFLEPEFVHIIEVESYKKFNEENTSKDPFFVDETKENKTKVMCSCFIF